ncbi:hypothetical protein DFQ14_101592 [Halopolyspora algeriensis]|uniref:Uncharacterized protein n=1 Tax=Halopolyspora algeriensis TaxID=1500506 RepID=A0A368W214_9ACTN|nr:hypothetical protein [Halopolyspora algeriensis]RCW47244.1 hypothetical protein DFQ14_101592 [Halopolyspora algeriensis]TQM42480.1 hypothetical protein FHU43_4110 [Halopolyspora algeriensis]
MDEVTAMSRAGENVGKAVGTGVRNARHGAVRASKAGAEIYRQAALLAEQELASRGISTDDLQERFMQRATSMPGKESAGKGKKARKNWDKKKAKSRKQLAKNAKAARKEMAVRSGATKPKGRRKWPWVLLALAGLAGAAAAVLMRRPEEMPVAQAEHNRFPGHDADGSHSNGSTEPARGDGQVTGETTALRPNTEQ